MKRDLNNLVDVNVEKIFKKLFSRNLLCRHKVVSSSMQMKSENNSKNN